MADVKVSALTTATSPDGTETVYIVQGGVSKKTTVADIRSIDVLKSLTATQTNSTVTPASITQFEASLAPGTYEVKGSLIWQSAAVGTGAGFHLNANGGTVTMNVGHVYTTTTGGAATTGIADQATAAGTFQMIEARAWRTNNFNAGPFGGVDTATAHQFAVLEAIIIVTATTNLQTMFYSEVAASAIVMQIGSSLKIIKTA